MKSFMTLIGIIFVIYGIGTLAYNGFTYNSRNQNNRFNVTAVTTETQQTLYFTPLAGGLSLALGTLILVLSQRGKRSKKR